MSKPFPFDLIDRGALFFVNHSGGKDSQAMYAHLRAIVPADQLVVIHADLGDIEWAGVQDHIRANIDHELHIAQAVFADGSNKDFFSAVRARRAYLDSKGKHDTPAFPSSAQRFCTSDLKTGPCFKVIKRIAKERGASIVVNCLGLRAEESTSRAKKEPFKVEKGLTTQSREGYTWLPIFDWSTEEVFQRIEQEGQKPHPAYADGNERLSCMFCIFGSKNDLRNAALANPRLYRRYVELERDTRGTMFNGQSLEERTGIKLIARS